MSTITITLHRETGKIEVSVPKPEDGVWSLTDGKPPSMEQRAHYFFWANGTSERIDELVKGHDGITVLQTLQWLINLRISDVKKRIGFAYRLVTHEEPPTSMRMKVAQ